MKNLTKVAVLLVTAGMVCGGTAYGAGGDAKKGQSIASNCAACHGHDGDHTTAQTIPKLAQQLEPYIEKQLDDFKSGARKNSIMSSMASTLSDQDVKDVAAYFSSQKMTADKVADKSLAEEGKKIFTGGIANKAVPACASCHGAHGEGMPLTFPRLAGQHAQYIVAQLKNFKSDARTNDPNGVMRTIASKLSDHQMEAVADYVSGL